MPHEAEIRLSHKLETEALDPGSTLVRHHRVPVAELMAPRVSGGTMLHLALASCVFNNITRMAAECGITLRDASVRVGGDFTPEGDSTGIECVVRVDADSDAAALAQLANDAFSDSTVGAVLKRATTVSLTLA